MSNLQEYDEEKYSSVMHIEFNASVQVLYMCRTMEVKCRYKILTQTQIYYDVFSFNI